MDIYAEMARKHAAGQPFVLATIVRTAGSSPRKVGAKMMVYPDGSISNTIGGGNFEKLVINDCLRLFDSKIPYLLKTYRFSENGSDATGMQCGGEAEVFMELTGRPERLIIFGGGHIGQMLAKVADGLNFKIIVVDDRKDILDRFNQPVETILTDPDYKLNFPSLDKSSYVIIVTHGHKCDRSVLEKAIKYDCAYIGMIGSKTKVAKTFSALEESGVDKSLLDKVHAPIGLDIGAEGPYEIAVAIAAELVATMRKTIKK